jgi:7-cyano-7-deazaguanine tRNA-ribosyltransferase
LAEGTPAFKEKAIFFFDPVDQHRPEARRFRNMVAKFASSKKKLVLFPEGEIHPFYATRGFKALAKKFLDAQIATYNPYLGIIPAEISDVFPAAHNLTPRIERRISDYRPFVESLAAFAGKFDDAIVVADDFMKQAMQEAKLNARVEDYTGRVIDRL